MFISLYFGLSKPHVVEVDVESIVKEFEAMVELRMIVSTIYMEHGIVRRSAHTKFSKDFNLNSHSQNYTTRLKCSDELRTSAKVFQTYIKPLPKTHKAENDNNN